MNQNTVHLNLDYYHELKDYESVVENAHCIKINLGTYSRYSYLLTDDGIAEEFDMLKKQIDSLEEENSKKEGEIKKLIKVSEKLNANTIQNDDVTKISFWQFLKRKYFS